MVQSRLQSAVRFALSFREKAYLIKTVLCAKAWHLAHVLLPTTEKVRTLHGVIFRFFWENKTERVQRVVLHQSVDRGGWSIPNVTPIALTLSLRTALSVLANPEQPAGVLAFYWLGPLGRHLFEFTNVNSKR